MQIELINAIKEFSIEAVKILGPAAIAAIVAYKSSKASFEAKLTELDKQNKFKVAQTIFELNKSLHEQLGASYKAISEDIFHIAGYISGGGNEEPSVSVFMNSMKVYTHRLPYIFERTERDIDKLKDKYELEYEEFHKAKTKYQELGEINQGNFIEFAVELEFIYSVLSQWGQILIGESMDEVFKEYSVNKSLK